MKYLSILLLTIIAFSATSQVHTIKEAPDVMLQFQPGSLENGFTEVALMKSAQYILDHHDYPQTELGPTSKPAVQIVLHIGKFEPLYQVTTDTILGRFTITVFAQDTVQNNAAVLSAFTYGLGNARMLEYHRRNASNRKSAPMNHDDELKQVIRMGPSKEVLNALNAKP